MSAHNILGKAGEDAAAKYLEQNGYTIRDRNWRKNHLELDIVADKDKELIIVEVKTRSNTDYIEPQDAVNWQKIRRIVVAADAYIKHFCLDAPVRFDIITAETAREYCLSKKAVTECFPFDEYSLVMKVMDKMFALIDLESANKICLKCDPEYALELREHYVAIEGAYHFNKKYWNQVFLDGDVDDKLLKQLIDHSMEEVLKKFTKKMRTEYEALP